jgi:hypothetical protein
MCNRVRAPATHARPLSWRNGCDDFFFTRQAHQPRFLPSAVVHPAAQQQRPAAAHKRGVLRRVAMHGAPTSACLRRAPAAASAPPLAAQRRAPLSPLSAPRTARLRAVPWPALRLRRGAPPRAAASAEDGGEPKQPQPGGAQPSALAAGSIDYASLYARFITARARRLQRTHARARSLSGEPPP